MEWLQAADRAQRSHAGREFCDLLEIDYDAIVEARRTDGSDNMEFFLSELVKIRQVRQVLRDLLG